MEEIKMKGRILTFDVVDNLGIKFPKSDGITYFEKVPIAYDYKFENPDMILGHATVFRDETGLICDATIINNDADVNLRDLLNDLNNELPIGGYYRLIEEHDENSVRIIDKANLEGIGVALFRALEEYKLVLVNESED